ncbi:MAG: adenylate/guanylate cyclase domain-containing protein [Geminicoccaceae bacterium]
MRPRPPRVTASADRLVLSAERDAVRLAAVVRVGVALALLAAFSLLPPPGLPWSFRRLIMLALAANLAIAGISWWLARAPRGWRSGTFFVVADFLLLVVVTLAAMRLLGLPTGMFAATPAFLVVVVLLALAALRYSPWSIALLTAGVAGFGLAMTAVQAIDRPLPGLAAAELPIFSPQANLLRVLMLASAGAMLTYVVVRGRRLLTAAVSIAERAANLSRYLPPRVADLVAAQGVEALSRGRQQPAAVLFADIVGFTAMAEAMPPDQVGRLLTAIRTLQREAIEGAGGIVDKFIGDAVMGVFGVPEPDPRAAARALAAAATLRQQLARWNEGRLANGEAAVTVGIGIHYGEVFAGAVGDSARLEFATLGDTVNVAQRCEALTRELDATLLVTRALLEAAGADLAAWEAIPARTVRGRRGSLDLYRPRQASAGSASSRSE